MACSGKLPVLSVAERFDGTSPKKLVSRKELQRKVVVQLFSIFG